MSARIPFDYAAIGAVWAVSACTPLAIGDDRLGGEKDDTSKEESRDACG